MPDVELSYSDQGAGPTVVLLHGLACHLGYWLRVEPLLGGLRVLALDFRGHGLSPHARSYRYEDYERDLLWLLDRVGIKRAAVAGHSLGGYVALLAASRSDRIARVLALDVKSDWTDGDAALAGRSRDAEQRIEPDRETLLDRLARSVAPTRLDRAELEALAERAIEPAGGGWRFRWDRRVLSAEPVDPFAFLAGVRCPVHVLAGSESAVMPPDRADAFASAIPGATVEIVPGAGHHVELDAPGRVAERIRRLAAA